MLIADILTAIYFITLIVLGKYLILTIFILTLALLGLCRIQYFRKWIAENFGFDKLIKTYCWITIGLNLWNLGY
jgi:hypothetical protein